MKTRMQWDMFWQRWRWKDRAATRIRVYVEEGKAKRAIVGIRKSKQQECRWWAQWQEAKRKAGLRDE
jgi:hypothetical protein